MSALLLDWRAAAAQGPAAAGGKGWQLALMAQLGVPVPDGFVIHAEASRGRRAGDPVPQGLRDALARELAARDWERTPLAVRSSAPQEDSAQASFAGIHLSRLNVTGVDAVAEAVQAAWDSVWEPAAVAYRQRLGLDGEAPAMAVVVMPLLAAVAAGIAFTCDPLSGRDDQLLIHAHWGLGEALVGGQADGDEYRLQSNESTDGDDALRVIERRVGGKQRMTRLLSGGGTTMVDTPAQQAAQAVLSDAQAVALGELARDAAGALDFANPRYDIEWVWDGERFWIVQARPVTARARHTYPALREQPRYWSRGNTREIMPDPLSALDWHGCRTMANRMLTLGFSLSGYPILPGTEHAALFDGRLYLDVSLMQWECYDALGVRPEAVNRLLGGTQPEIAVPPPTAGDRLARGLRMLRYLARSPGQRRLGEAALARAAEQARQWREQALPDDPAALAALLREQFRTVAQADPLFFLQGSAGGTLAGLVDLVEKYCPGEGYAVTAALMAGGESSVTAQQGYALIALAETAAADAEALAWLRSPKRSGAQWAQQLPAHSPFRRAFAGFLDRYGHRATAESYVRQPRWREAPDYLLDTVLGMIGSNAEAVRQRQRVAAAQAWQRLRRAIPPLARPAMLAVLKRLVRVATRECNQREAARSALMRYLEAVRRTALALGTQLARGGKEDGFERPDDVFHLTAFELLAVAEGRMPLRHAARRAARRAEVLADQADRTEPAVIVEQPGALPAVFSSAEPSATYVADAAAGRWSGTPVGAGQARGPACVARSPQQATAMANGDILVAPSTDPAWTPLFLRAGGLVMETGGYLSHGAIVAREFGIPAVVNLPGILSQLADGDMLAVDGNRGTVQRVAAS
ncbi:PEP/pyruvate-binding domain-containing protein [Cupriavidus gilardii]|uniref:PEP/pyruvate-binding domain-containing protein n=1 Tax=Cupriavidus gilardii TaxID=82541 RepID=UPI0007E48E9F|nr:PEP/pyruvate-binding domain-containing protein [Cupriavidus gilardii]